MMNIEQVAEIFRRNNAALVAKSAARMRLTTVHNEPTDDHAVDTCSDPPISERLGELAHALSSDGVAANEVGLRQTARWARAAGVSPVLVDVLTDPTLPEIVRMRAFGKVAAALAAPRTVAPQTTLRVA